MVRRWGRIGGRGRIKSEWFDDETAAAARRSRSMSTNVRGAGVVGYNVQTAVDTEPHLIVAHEVTNNVVDRGLLSTMAGKGKEAMAAEEITVIADRGYFGGREVLSCEAIGANPLTAKSLTSGAKADGRFGKQDSSILRTRMSIAARPVSYWAAT